MDGLWDYDGPVPGDLGNLGDLLALPDALIRRALQPYQTQGSDDLHTDHMAMQAAQRQQQQQLQSPFALPLPPPMPIAPHAAPSAPMPLTEQQVAAAAMMLRSAGMHPTAKAVAAALMRHGGPPPQRAPPQGAGGAGVRQVSVGGPLPLPQGIGAGGAGGRRVSSGGPPVQRADTRTWPPSCLLAVSP